ncbi:MAG TPA: metalloregulator ArsR/SmtB family transcription factor [Planctomycetota bacterium]|nr:metalloregulator ArsR/SmtB family transcription factor [Planctomycetota bacterium]
MKDDEFVRIAKALADPTRRRMLDALRGAGELNCSQLCALFPLRQPTISHHVKTLQEAGLVVRREEGAFHVMSLDAARLRDFAAALDRPRGAARSAARGTRVPARTAARRRSRA